MFSVNVEVDGKGSFPHDFSVGGEGASSLLDVLASARTRFNTPHVPYRVASPTRLLKVLDRDCCIIPRNSSIVVIDGPMKGFENQQGLWLLLVQQLTIDKSPSTSFRPLHCMSCVPYVTEGIQLETMPKIEQVSLNNPEDINNPVVYGVDGGATTEDDASHDGVTLRTVGDVLNAALGLQGLALESKQAEGISLALTSFTTTKHIAIPEDQADELYRQKLYDLEIPGPLIHVDVARGMQVIVRRLTGSTQTHRCFPHETVGDLHKKVAKSETWPVDMQRFVFPGAGCLNAEKTLVGYGIGHQSVVHLVIRLGMFHPSSGRTDDMNVLDDETEPKEVTMHFPNGGWSKLFVRGYEDLMDAAHGHTRCCRPGSDCEGVRTGEETAEESVERLRNELHSAEKDLEAFNQARDSKL